MNYGRHYNDEDLDMYCRIQLTIDEVEYILGYKNIDVKTIVYEIQPGIHELIDLNTALPENLKVKADEKFMKTVLTTKDDENFNSDLNEILGFTNKEYKAGTHLSEKVINITSVDKLHVNCNCIDGSILDGKPESILFSHRLDARTGYKIFEGPISSLLKKVNKNKIDDIILHLEDNDGH